MTKLTVELTVTGVDSEDEVRMIEEDIEELLDVDLIQDMIFWEIKSLLTNRMGFISNYVDVRVRREDWT